MPPEDNHKVYDDDQDKTGSGADSEKLKKIHKNPIDPHDNQTEPKDNLRDLEEAGNEEFYQPSGDEVRQRSLDSAHSTLSELAGAKGDSGLYSQGGDDGGPKVMKTLKNTLRQRRKVVAGGGVAAGIGTIILVTFFLLIPLKIEHVVHNLEKHFFATSEDAVQKETSILLRGYVVRILPTYKTCGSTISKDCKVNIRGNGPVNNLYRTWANARLENKLAKNYGIEFKHNKTSKHWLLKAPGAEVGGDDIGLEGRGFNTDFERSNRSEMRRAIHEAMGNETRWKKMMYRYKVGRLLEEKYGIKRCIVYCGTRDKVADKIDLQKKAATLKLVQRVLTPRSETLGIAIECMITNCKATDSHPTDAEDGTTAAQNGSPESETDQKAREVNQRLNASYGAESLEKINADTKELEEKGLSKVITERFLGKILPKLLAEKAANAIPVVGTVIFASQMIDFVHNSAPAVEKLAYTVNSGAYAQTWGTYSTYASEVHTGGDTAAEIGSFTNSLGPGNRGTKANPQVGGTGGAESSLVYQNIIDGKSPNRSRSTVFDDILPGKALAASADSSSNKKPCNGDKPIPAGELVCPEVVLTQNKLPEALQAPSQFLSLPVVSQVSYVAGGISGIVNGIAGVLGGVITSIPGVGAAVQTASDLTAKVLQPFFAKALNLLINNPFGLYMSGSRLFDILAGGADVAGNLFAQVGLGGQALTDGQAAKIIGEQQTQDQENFARQSMFARMFDTSSEYSLVSKVAMTVPFGLQADAQSGVASLLNPFGAFGRGFGSLFGRVSAADPLQKDPFGVTQYGVLSLPEDPEAYWNKYCSDNASYAYRKDNSWNEAAAHTIDKATGMPRNDTPNPCLTIKATVGVAGGLFNTDLLTQDDLGSQGGSSGSGAAAPTDTAGATIDMSHLFDDSTSIACAPGTKDAGTDDGYHDGQKVKIRLCEIPNLATSGEENQSGHAILNSRVSGAVFSMIKAAKDAGVTLSANSSFRTMSHQQQLWAQYGMDTSRVAQPGYSNHQMGLAIDFNGFGSGAAPGSGPGWNWMASHAANYGYKNYPAEAWHWSPTGN
jgi:hypothetical protein